MGMRLGGEYMELRFNPKRHGWEETADEQQIRGEFTAADLAGLKDVADVKVHTWTRGHQVITLAMIGDYYIHTAVVDGVVADTHEWIEIALDLLDGVTTPKLVVDEATPPRTYSDEGHAPIHVEDVARAFQKDITPPATSSGPAYVAVTTWTSSSGCAPMIVAADDPNLLLVRLVQALEGHAKSGHLANHVDEVFLASHPIPQLPDEVDEHSPTVFEADSWLTALSESSSDPSITYHETSVATRFAALDPEWGLNRDEIALLIKLAAITGREFDTVGTGTDYDAFDLALNTFGRDRDYVRELARRAFSRVVERSDVA